jgi:hypothetical protein
MQTGQGGSQKLRAYLKDSESARHGFTNEIEFIFHS